MGETKSINIIVFITIHMIFKYDLIFYYLLCSDLGFSLFPFCSELNSSCFISTFSCFIQKKSEKVKGVERLHKVSPSASRIFFLKDLLRLVEILTQLTPTGFS